MNGALSGRLILVVEDELPIALDLNHLFQSAGARVVQAGSLQHVLLVAQTGELSAAVVDHAFIDGNSTELCTTLTERNIPYIIYTEYGELHGACSAGVLIQKPASNELLLSTMILGAVATVTLAVHKPAKSEMA